jgi:hypothetical protein
MMLAAFNSLRDCFSAFPRTGSHRASSVGPGDTTTLLGQDECALFRQSWRLAMIIAGTARVCSGLLAGGECFVRRRIVDMKENPYESAMSAGSARGGLAGLSLKLLAISFWGVSLLLVFGIVATWNRPEVASRTAKGPVLAATVWIVGFGFPIIGFAVLGVASWCRRWAFALVGLAAFIPLLTFLLYHWIRRL